MLGRRTLIAMAAALMCAAPASAATPGSGAVSPQAPQTVWNGEVVGPAGVAYVVAGGSGAACLPPGCDTYTLEVATDGSTPLTVDAESITPAQEISIEVVLPSGDTAFAGSLNGPQNHRSLKIPSAPAGTYTVHISGGSLPGRGSQQMLYRAAATLGTSGLECRMTRPFPYETGGTPATGAVNDPLFADQPGLRMLRAAAAWARGGRGQGVTIAVLDTGVDLNHPDLRENLVAGVDMIEGQGSDCAPGPYDSHGHGTHVSGLAAAVADNGIGIAGVAPEARIMPIRICGTGGCSIDDINAGIRWATDHGAGVINMSLGADEVDRIIGLYPEGAVDLSHNAEAVRYAVDRGVVVVASAGNANWIFCGHPGADPGAVCVAALDRDGRPASYSNLPFDRDGEVDAFRAFGGDGDTCETLAISTGWPGAGVNLCGAAYQGLAGTSMASPQVAGAAAVLLSLGVKPGDVVERLKATASNGGRYDPVMGYGVPDLDAATKALSRKRCRRGRRASRRARARHCR